MPIEEGSPAPEGEPVESGFGDDGKMDVNAVVDDMAVALRLAEEPEGEPKDETKGDEPPPPPAGEQPPSEPKLDAEGKPVPDKPAEPADPIRDWIPSTWRPEAQAKFKDLPKDIRDEVVKRELDMSRFVNDTHTQVQVAKSVGEILQPYQDLFTQYNVNPMQHIKTLLQGHTTLLFGTPEQKYGMMRQLAQDAGINLAAVVDPNAQPAQADQTVAYVRALERKVAELQGNVTGVAATLQQQREAELSQTIAGFAADTEHNPYFWNVAPDIVTLLQQKSARTLQEAYEIACSRNPLVRNEMISSEIAKQKKLDVQKANERAAAARKASSANVRSRGGGSKTPPTETIDDTLRTTLAEINSRTH